MPPGLSTPALIRELRAARYDLAVDLFFNPRSAWLLRLAGIPYRIGGARSGRRRLYTHTVLADEIRDDRRAASLLDCGGVGDHLARLAPLRNGDTGEPFLTWLERAGAAFSPLPSLAPDRFDQGAAFAALQAVGVAPRDRYVLLAPGATWRSKEWPAEHWCELAKALAQETDLSVVALSPPAGGAAWSPLASAIPQGRGGLLAPMDLPTALAVVAGAGGVVSVDGGLMHASVGLGRPTLALFGPTDPGIWFPYQGCGPFRVLARRPHCHPCDRLVCDEFVCLPELAPATAVRALLELLSAAPPPAERDRR